MQTIASLGRVFLSSAVALLLGWSSASASGFYGFNVQAQYDWPTLGTVVVDGGFTVAGPGVEFTDVNAFQGGADIDFSNTNILVTYPSNFILAGGATFEGWDLSDQPATDPIIGVSVGSATNLAGFSASNLSFDSHHVYVNLAGLGTPFPNSVNTLIDPNTLISIDVAFGSATPVPGALPLFASGLGALGLLGWRRKRKAQVVVA